MHLFIDKTMCFYYYFKGDRLASVHGLYPRVSKSISTEKLKFLGLFIINDTFQRITFENVKCNEDWWIIVKLDKFLHPIVTSPIFLVFLYPLSFQDPSWMIMNSIHWSVWVQEFKLYNFLHSKLTYTLDRPGELFSKQVSEKNIIPGIALTYNYFQTCKCMDGVKCLRESELMKEPLTYM